MILLDFILLLFDMDIFARIFATNNKNYTI